LVSSTIKLAAQLEIELKWFTMPAMLGDFSGLV
jgi:hypothetical protein